MNFKTSYNPLKMIYAELTVFLLIRKSCTIKNEIKIVWRNSNLLYSYQKLTSMTIVEVVKYRLLQIRRLSFKLEINNV